MAEPRLGFTGMVINEITFKNFGQSKLNGKVAFTRPYEPCFATDELVFEALNCLLDPRFEKHREEGDNAVQDHPVVGVKFRLGEKLYDYVLDQRLIRNVKPTHTGKLPNQFRGHQTWKDLMRDFHFIPNEPFMTTPLSVINVVSEQLLDDITNLQRELALLTIKAVEYRPGIDEEIEVTNIKSNILYDQSRYKLIRRYKVNALSPRYTALGSELLEIQNSLENCPEQGLHLKVIDVSIKKMILEIADDQQNRCLKGMTQLKDRTEAIYQFDEILFKGRIEHLFIQTKRNQQMQEYTRRQIQFYNNPSFMLEYKREIEASSGWENEKNNIARKKDEEYNFQLDLEDEINEKTNALATARQKILDSQKKVEDLIHDMDYLQSCVKHNLPLPFVLIQTCYIKMQDFVKKSFEKLSPLLNDSSLQVADIKNCIAGYVHHVFGVTEQPHYLFDDLTCSRKRKGGFLQCFLAPLSNVLFYQTSVQAVENLERIMSEDTPWNSQATFSFTGIDNICLNVQIEENVWTLSKCRKILGYNNALKNVLSHFCICNDEKIVGPPFCLLNLKKEIVHFCEGEKMTVTTLGNLFTLLRVVKKLYKDIAEQLISFNNLYEDIKKNIKDLIVRITNCYLLESEVHSEMINLQNLCYSELNIYHTLQALEQLRLGNKKRLNIYRHMLLLEDSSDPDFIGTLEAQTTNVLMLEHVETDLAINVYPTYSTNLDILLKFTERMQNSRIYMIESLTNIHSNWNNLLGLVNIAENKKQLCYYVNVDSIRLAFLKTKIKHYQKKLIGRRRNINNPSLTTVQSYIKIDKLLLQTQYPMINYDTLTKFMKHIDTFQRNISILDKIPSFLYHCLNSSQVFIRIQANKLSKDLETFLTYIRADAGIGTNISVRCDLQHVELDNTDWSRHVLKEIRKVQSLHFYEENATLDQNISTCFAILVYIGYIIHYTYQPLILNQLLKGIQPDVLLTICRYLLLNPPSRFTLVRVEHSMLQINQDLFRDNVATLELQVPGNSTDPAPGTSIDPAPGTSTDPAPGTSTDPAPGTSADPAPGTSTDPAPGTSTDPVTGTSTDPVTGTSIDPAPGTSTDPAPGTSTDTVTGTSINPVTGTSTDPSTGLSAEQRTTPLSRIQVQVQVQGISQVAVLPPITEEQNVGFDIDQEDLNGQPAYQPPANQPPAHLPQASPNLRVQQRVLWAPTLNSTPVVPLTIEQIAAIFDEDDFDLDIDEQNQNP